MSRVKHGAKRDVGTFDSFLWKLHKLKRDVESSFRGFDSIMVFNNAPPRGSFTSKMLIWDTMSII